MRWASSVCKRPTDRPIPGVHLGSVLHRDYAKYRQQNDKGKRRICWPKAIIIISSSCWRAYYCKVKKWNGGGYGYNTPHYDRNRLLCTFKLLLILILPLPNDMCWQLRDKEYCCVITRSGFHVNVMFLVKHKILVSEINSLDKHLCSPVAL